MGKNVLKINLQYNYKQDKHSLVTIEYGWCVENFVFIVYNKYKHHLRKNDATCLFTKQYLHSGHDDFSVTKNVEYFTKNDWSNLRQHKTCQHLCYIVQDKCFDDYFFFWRRECDI